MNQAQEDKVKRYMGSTGQKKILLMLEGDYYLADATHSSSSVWEYDAVITLLPMPVKIVGLKDLDE